MDTLKEKIEQKIKEGKIKMKPRSVFVFKTIFLIAVILILFLSAIYIANFVLFIFHEHAEVFRALYISPFNAQKIFEFIKIIPGLLLLLFVILIICGFVLIKDFSFAYRRSRLGLFVVIFLALILFLISFHFLIDGDFHFARFGEKGEVPFLQKVHMYYRPDDFIRMDARNLPEGAFPSNRIRIVLPLNR